MVSLDDEVAVYYQNVYRPDRHARAKQWATRSQFVTDIGHFNAALHHRQCMEDPEKTRPLRNARLSDLDDATIKYAMGWQLARGRSEGTANRLYRALKALANHARKSLKKGGLVLDTIDTDPYDEPDCLPIAWSLEEAGQILAGVARVPGKIGGQKAGIVLAAWCWSIYSTGGRFRVMRFLPTANFDNKRGELLLPAIQQKQNADQRHKLIEPAIEALEALQAKDRGLPFLFSDLPKHATAFNKHLRRGIVESGVRASPEAVTDDDLSHKFRRTFATLIYIKEGIEVARQLLGHSDVSVTWRYIDLRFASTPNARDILPTPPTPPDNKQLRLYDEAG